MKKLVIVIFLLPLLLLFGCEFFDEDDTPINDIEKLTKTELHGEYIEWQGRHQYKDDLEYFYYTGTGFKITVMAQIVEINFELFNTNKDIYFSVSKDSSSLLDDQVFILSSKTKKLKITFDIYDKHTLEVIKRSEPEDGVTAVSSIVTNGYIEKASVNTNPHFLLIGASGISGHGALGNPNESRTTKNSSSLHSFGYLSAYNFSASFEFVSNSGFGLAFGFNDVTGNTNIEKAYEKIGINERQEIIDVAYNHEKKADAIIVNIGGNDYSAVINNLSEPEKTVKINEFKTAVERFLLKLRKDHPNAHIFWTMTANSRNGNAALEVINKLDDKDLEFVHMVEILGVAAEGDLAGANNHCSYITHQKSADILTKEILKYTELTQTKFEYK